MNRKLQHEQFVINEDGTSTLRYVVFFIQMSLSIFIPTILVQTFPSICRNRLLSFLVEFICLHSFPIFSATILDDYYLLLLGFQISIVYFILQIKQNECKYKSKTSECDRLIKETKPKNEMMRSISMNILISTTIMILAVDFKVFPRRNAKIEHFGIGLMDAGAVCFLAVNSILSPEARLLKKRSKIDLSSDILDSSANRSKVITKCLNSSTVLFLIGLIRLFTIKKINYQEHVTEYGVHMNFFLLLASIKVIGMVLSLSFSRIIFHPSVGFLFLCFHEVLLKLGFSKYIQKDEGRTSFLDKNKESFYTLLGYVGFYLSCYNLSYLAIIEKNKPTNEESDDQASLQDESKNRREYQMMLRSFKWFLFYFVVYVFSDQLSEKISRRNMNLAFTCLTLAAINLLCCVEHFWIVLNIRYYATSNFKLIIRNAYTNNGLIAFLLANILTGFVNISANSMQTTDLKAIVLLFAYSFAVSISVCFLESLNSFFN